MKKNKLFYDDPKHQEQSKKKETPAQEMFNNYDSEKDSNLNQSNQTGDYQIEPAAENTFEDPDWNPEEHPESEEE